MLRYDREIDMRAEIKLPDEALATETLVGDSRSAEGHRALSQIISCRFSCHGVEPDPLHPELARVEGLAPGKEPGVGVGSGTQVHVSVTRTDQGGGNAGAIVHRMPHVLEAELVVANLTEDVSVTDRDEVICLIDTTVAGQGQNSLF